MYEIPCTYCGEMQRRSIRRRTATCEPCGQLRDERAAAKRYGKDIKRGVVLRNALEFYRSGPTLSPLAEKVLAEYGFVRKDKG